MVSARKLADDVAHKSFCVDGHTVAQNDGDLAGRGEDRSSFFGQRTIAQLQSKLVVAAEALPRAEERATVRTARFLPFSALLTTALNCSF